MKEKLKELWLYLKRRKKFYFLLFVIFLLLLGLIFSLSAKKAQRLRLVTPSPAPAPRESGFLPPGTTTSPQPPPQVFFETYENKTSLPTVPDEINLYTLKTNYNLEEALAFGQKLGLTDYKEEGSFVVIYNLGDKEKRGLLVFNKETGGFSFQSFGVTRGPTASTNPQAVAATFLASLGVADETVSCNITYQKQELPDVTFVECHRDWQLAGLPILGFPGVLNIPEGKPLSSLTLGETDENFPTDPSIVNVTFSPGRWPNGLLPGGSPDGKVRPNDFNTATVAVASDGMILSIDSNLRQIVQTTVNTSQELSTPQQALDQFINHQAQLSLTIPAGQGTVDWNKVYQDNKAYSPKATITDYVLVYLEKPAQALQDKLVPHYLVYGIAPLTSGYNVRFVETIPALRSGLSFLSPATGTVAGTSTLLAQEDKSLKLGTFTPVPTSAGPTPTQMFSSPSPTLALPSPTPLQTSPGTNECDPSSFSPIFELPGVGTVGMAGGLFFSITAIDQDIDNIRRAFFDLVGEQYTILMAVFLQANPSFVPNSPSYSSLTSLFDDLNKDIQPGRPIGNPAPITSSLWQIWYGTPWSKQEEALNQIVNKTVDQLIAALNNNTLNQLADRQNIFPQQVMDIFYATYIIIESYPEERYKGCKYISGSSPAIFLYPQKPTKVAVTISSSLTYTDPSVKDNSWQVIAYPDGMIKGSFGEQDYLYYEYEPVAFEKPKDGWVVEVVRLEELVRETLSPALGLNDLEEQRLVFEFNHASFYLNSDYVFVGLIPQQEVEEELPLEVSPELNNVVRLHFYLAPALDKEQIASSLPSRIPRTESMLLELGAVKGKL